MPLFGAFAPSVSAMMSQSHALNVIGKNVANVSTGGYKRIDTHFASLVSAPLARGGGAGEDVLEVKSSSDFGGVRTKDFNRIADQGNIVSSLSDLDIAINGSGMFVLNTGFGGTGETLYTRDGALQILTGEQLTVNGIGGVPTQVDTGYLADKNGFLLQGIPANPDGTFNATGTPQDMRVDPFAFSTLFLPTSTGTLTMNLPATDEITKPQVDIVTLAGVAEAGDQYSITIDGTTITTTVAAGQSLNSIRDTLVTAINANATTSAVVTAAAGGDGVVRLTNNNIISSFTTTATAVNGGIIADNGATASVLHVADSGTEINTFSFQIIDSAGGTENIRLAFDKVAENAWEMRSTTFQTPTAQVDTVNLAGSVEAGDQYTISVGGQSVTYTVNGLEAGIADIRNGVISAMINNATIDSTFNIAAGATAGEFTITSRTAGVPFTTTASVADLNVAQVDTLTIGGTVGALEAGDTYTATINGTTVTYTVTGLEPTLTDVRNNFLAAINADPTVSAAVTATPGGPIGAIVLTANTAGTSFTSAAGFTDILGGVNDSSTVVVNTTAGSNGDNTAAVVTTTANVPSSVTAAPISMTFDGAGNLTSASTLNLSFNFQGGTTGAIALDLIDVTQFAGDFIPQDFTRDGFGLALLRSVDFNSKGEVIGNFDDGTIRKIYRLPLADFINVDGLERRSGNTFVQSINSGPPTIRFAGGTDSAAKILPNAHELSNVELADEFTEMITVQTAYNAASKAFTTVDEMLTVARDLKR